MADSEADFDTATQARMARTLVRTALDGALGTLDESGTPRVAHVATATLPDGMPLILVSDLSQHTRNMKRDPRVSLMLVAPPTPGADTYTRPRLSIFGHAHPVEDRDLARDRFLRRQPHAELYIDFGDFNLLRIVPEAAHLVAGFGRVVDLAPERFLEPADLARGIAAVDRPSCAHMNDDHADALAAMAVAEGAPAGDWRAIGVDPQGIDLFDGERVVRSEFAAAVGDGTALRQALKASAEQARTPRG